MRRAHLIFLSAVMAAIVLLSLFTYTGQLAYTFYQSLDISGSEVNGVSKGCRDKTKLFGMIEVVDVDRYCQSGGPLEEQFQAGEDMGPAEGPIDKGGTPRENLNDVSRISNGTPSEQASASRSYLPYIIVIGIALSAIWMWQKRRRIPRQFEEESSFAEPLQKNPEIPSNQQNKSTVSLPASTLRQHLIHFEQALPVPKRRLPHETLSTWAARIGLDAPLLPYFETRYDEGAVLDTRQATIFERQLTDYLSQMEKE